MLLRPQHTVGNDDVHVWHLLAEDLNDPGIHDTLGALLSVDEQHRRNRFRHPRDRALFLLSRGLLRSVLMSYLGCSCEELQFTTNPFGKPILQDTSPRLHFNLSHSRGAVALAISRGRNVGVDVEEWRRDVDYLGLAQRYFADVESRYLETLGPNERGPAFFALWTLKEAYVKGIGRGLTFPLDAFSFELDVSRLIAFRPLADFVACDWAFQQFDLGVRHCGAVAIEGQGARVEMHDWAATFL